MLRYDVVSTLKPDVDLTLKYDVVSTLKSNDISTLKSNVVSTLISDIETTLKMGCFQLHKVKGYRHTDRPTYRPTCATQYAPPSSKGGLNIIVVVFRPRDQVQSGYSRPSLLPVGEVSRYQGII